MNVNIDQTPLLEIPPLPEKVREMLTGTHGTAALYVYVGSVKDPTEEFDNWIIELPYLRDKNTDDEDSQYTNHTGFLSGFLFPLDIYRSLKTWDQKHENPGWKDRTYYVSIAQIFGDDVRMDAPDSWEDYDDVGMQWFGDDVAVAKAHMRLLVERLLNGEIVAEAYEAPAPGGFPTWEAYEDDLRAQAAVIALVAS